MSNIPAIVRQCSAAEGYTFDPGSHIRAANALQREEEGRLIEGLRSYARLITESADLVLGGTRLSLLVRILFAPTDPQTPFLPMGMGKPSNLGNPRLKDFPLYPIVLLKDVPLLIVTGFMLGGLPRDPMDHVDFCERHCRLRTKPLRPPDDPLPLADELMTSDVWHTESIEHDRGVLRAQLLRLVRAVYPVPEIDEPTAYSHVIPSTVWELHLRTYGNLHVFWEAEKSDYRTLNGGA